MKKINYIFLLIMGILILFILFYIFGFKQPLTDILIIKFGYIPIIGIFLINHILLCIGWRVLIIHPLKIKKFYMLVIARIAGDATTIINKLAAAAGEPLKALYLKDIIPLKTGLASVVLDRTIHMLGNLLLIITGIMLAFFKLQVPIYILIFTLFIFIILFILILKILKKQKKGFFKYLISKLPDWLQNKLATKNLNEKITLLDKEIEYIFSSHKNKNHFYISLIFHTFPVLFAGSLEVYLILIFSNHAIPLLDAMLVYLFSLFLTTIVFFMPLDIGTSEGSFSIILKLLDYNPAWGLSIGFARRIRTLVWTGLGMLLLFQAGLNKKSIKKLKSA